MTFCSWLWQTNHGHYKILFLDHGKEQGVKLNTDKLTLSQNELLFTGYVVIGQGLQGDQSKVQAIAEMPAKTGKVGVQRLMGLAQYLSKFLPYLSANFMTNPLRDLPQNDVQWI